MKSPSKNRGGLFDAYVEKYKQKYLQSVERKHTVVLSKLDDDGKLINKRAPLMTQDRTLSTYITAAAANSYYLEKKKRIDALLTAEEVDTTEALTTVRARTNCTPTNIGNVGHEDIFELFHNCHGKA